MQRVDERIRDWNVVVQDTLETETSFLAFGARDNRPVVLKVVRRPGDEWRSGEVLRAFDARAVARVYEYAEGAVLMERLNPGTQLVALTLEGRDEQATEIIADVIQRMSHPGSPSEGFVTVADRGRGFERYLASGDDQIARGLVEQGQELYFRLCSSQRGVRLLHGDLHHYNILFDIKRGWTAVDPKGVLGELEYEVGASLRNPYEMPESFASREAVLARLKLYESRLKLDRDRALGWGFAQAILSAIWAVEDGYAIDESNTSMMLAKVIRSLLW
ncbi:MAG TPA: aminoglycoside phosphotransferase family protein [Blastocatellia bacterium]|nr:aminoglycoside phosphotransferase family protein [Blastocatellia bacterium]